jgi:hypothetical protein
MGLRVGNPALTCENAIFGALLETLLKIFTGGPVNSLLGNEYDASYIIRVGTTVRLYQVLINGVNHSGKYSGKPCNASKVPTFGCDIEPF